MALNFPDSPTLNQVYSTGGKTWSYNGSRWVLVIATAIIDVADGSITAAKIADGTVVAAEIASNAITTAKILDANITTAKIASSAVTTDKIASDAVTTAKILDANVTTAKVAANAITQAKLGTTLSAVTVTTAANRDTAVASPFTGQLVFLTDTKKIQVWDGTSWLNITLAPPETPTSLSATALSTTSVSIAFTAGGANGSPITNYKYALSTNGGSTYGSFTAVNPADATTPITISGLTAATTYYIKLKAVNDMGDSVASAAVSIGTLSTPDAPTSLSAGSITTTSVAISFTPGSDNGYAISNYQYALSTDSGSTYGSFTALSPADATSPITITGLTVGTSYYVKLKAVNSGGAGTESSAVSFTITALSVDYLVVAGGGAGAAWQGGGGGAGGLRSTVTATGGGGTLGSVLAPTLSTNYTVTVGAGGTGAGSSGNTQGLKAANGSNSVFSTITSAGGGGGAGYIDNGGSGAGVAGGSGGGGGSSSGNYSSLAGGAGTANQGYLGGGGYSPSPHGGGGGGGAGAGGQNASAGQGGNGGVGVAVSITGSSVFYAGGGGGSAGTSSGGNGGGGAGTSNSVNGVNATSGTANRGGGGGGEAAGDASGGSGGSGVVILRYNSAYTIALGAGLTGSTSTVGSNKVTTITAGSGNVSWA